MDIRDAERSISNMVSRGVVKRVKSTTKTQQLQVGLYADETRSDIEHPQEYGFASAPLEGAEALVIFMGGNRDSGSVQKVFDKRYHPRDLSSGDVMIYRSDGAKVHLKANGNIEITAATEIKLITPKVTVTGDLEVNGNITDQSEGAGISMQSMRTIYNGHTHPETGTTTQDPNQSM